MGRQKRRDTGGIFKGFYGNFHWTVFERLLRVELIGYRVAVHWWAH